MYRKCILAGALIFSILPRMWSFALGSEVTVIQDRPDTVLIGLGVNEGGAQVSGAPDTVQVSGGFDLSAENKTEAGSRDKSENEEEESGAKAPEAGENDGEAKGTENDWTLILVNREHPIPEDYQIPALTQLQNDNSVDSRIYPDLQRMFDDARSQGLYPYVTSSFRTHEKQQALMDQKVEEYLASGYDREQAQTLAQEWVAIPGTSEHELGLSVDISAAPYSGQDPGSVWYWLEEHAWEYGFIRRYPEEKTEITGIINEPWHFRYVGEPAATAMHESGLCLEEYLGEAD